MNKLLFLLALSFGLLVTQGQELLTPSVSFSHRKTAYVTLKDGTEIQGNIDKIKRNKGLIEEVKINTLEGKKMKISPSDIDHMYLPPSTLDKVNNFTATVNDANRWTNQKIDENILNQGYVYFENATVKVKKKTEELLVQLLNPTTSKVVKIYFDPRAGKTTSATMYGVSIAGNRAKSYYFSVNDGVAYKIKKSDYSSEQQAIYGKCLQSIKDEHGSLVWRDLHKHLITFSDCVSNN